MEVNIRELTLDNIGVWPLPVKVVCILLTFLFILFAGYWFDARNQLETLASLQQKQHELLKTVKIKHETAANLQHYRQQLEDVNLAFRKILRQLPKRSEIPGLLEDISKTGLANGLQFKLFKPQEEIPAGFYVELPIKISVVGNYHQIALFISEIAGLDRIVTLHDFTVKPVEVDTNTSTQPKEQLQLEILAKTYRYSPQHLGQPKKTNGAKKGNARENNA